MGSAPPRAGASGPSADFDLGELRRAATQPPPMPREPLSVRLASWRAHRTRWWRAALVALVVAVVAGFAGWHVGGDRARSETERWISANPGLVGWIVDNGPDLASSPRDPREDVELHLLNVGRDPVIIQSMSATSDGAPVDVNTSSYQPVQVPTGGTTIAAAVLRTACTTEYSEASLVVRLSRTDPQGDTHATVLTVGAEATLGQSVSEVLNGLCANPTRGQDEPGVDGVTVDQTSGVSGATVTLTNTSEQPRQAEITSDESPAFELVSSRPGPQLIRPGQSLDFRLQLRVLRCTAIVGLQDWASTISLQVGRPGDSLVAAAGSGVLSSYPLPDVVLVPGGAAIQRACAG